MSVASHTQRALSPSFHDAEPVESIEMSPPNFTAEQEPLLSPTPESSTSQLFRSTSSSSLESQPQKPTREVEDDVIPETSTTGRTLSPLSAYILIISRVVGSGIFATPGSIVKTTGSIGLAFLLWILGVCIKFIAMF